MPFVLNEIARVREQFQTLEIIVVDNGSDDTSVEVARRHQVRVVTCAERGYGAAVHAGILAASHEVVVFADSDATYNWSEAPILVRELLQSNMDIVVGNRFRRKMESGAMPLLHRYLGTPVLSWIIQLLHARATGLAQRRVRDCNSGFRALRRTHFLSWDLRCRGMEFASEMIVTALQRQSRYSEIPISYRAPVVKNRVSNLRPWRDGWRHLRVILQAKSGAPRAATSTLIDSVSELAR